MNEYNYNGEIFWDYLCKNLYISFENNTFDNVLKLLKDYHYNKYLKDFDEIDCETEKILKQQKKSLDVWLEFLLSPDNSYPEWFKYYLYQGILKLGDYDSKTNSFSKRLDTTFAPFIELNKDVLDVLYENLCKYFYEKNILDELKILVENGKFSNLYAETLWILDKRNKSNIEKS